MALPGFEKPLEQFHAEDTSCREWAAQRTQETAQGTPAGQSYGASANRFIRLSFAASDAVIEQGIRRIGEFDVSDCAVTPAGGPPVRMPDLVGVRHLVDECTVQEDPQHGTHVTLIKWRPN